MNIAFFRKILIVVLFLFFASFLIREASALTQDLGRHLKLGEIILAAKSVSKINLFSYGEPNHEFINSHWLSEIIFYLIFKTSGFPGLIVFVAIIYSLSFAVMFFLARRKDNFWLSFFVALFTIGILLERTDIRPEIFSFLTFSIFLYILLKNLDKEQMNKAIWFLPLLQIFWTNLHIYFFLGPVFFLFFFLDKIIRRGRFFKDYIRGAEFRKMALLTLLMISAVFINPNGIDGAFYPLKVMGAYGYSIVENQTPFFLSKFNYHQSVFFFFFLFFAVLAMSFLANLGRYLKEVKIFNFLSTLFMAFFGLYAVRNFPIFAIATAPLIVYNLSVFYLGFKSNLSGFLSDVKDEEEVLFPAPKNSSRFFEKILIVAAFIFLIGGIYINSRKFNLGVPSGSKKAVDFVIENNISGNMFNNYDIGSYLIWRLYPRKKVFVDNRPEAYSVNFLQSVYIAMQENEELWQKYSKEYDFNFIIFEHTDITPWARSFLSRIQKDPSWPLVYIDNRAMVFVKNSPVNKEIIDKYAVVK